jgi:N6-L-threonylcarbamoyladenine synthase
MLILGIETSCDETAAAVVRDGREVLSNVIHSQIDIHKVYGGVVPEVAARSHIEVILPVITEALQQAEVTWDDIDAIGVTYAPGLIGSLLIGSLTARTAAIIHNKPLYKIHHIEGHVYANFLLSPLPPITSPNKLDLRKTSRLPDQSSTNSETVLSGGDEPVGSLTTEKQFVDGDGQSGGAGILGKSSKPRNSPSENCIALGGISIDTSPSDRRSAAGEDGVYGEAIGGRGLDPQPQFPMLALIVSGGHSQLVLFRNHGNYTLLGQTQDDAVGEAFDKVAKIIGLPYPGGPSISKAAELGDDHAFMFPKAHMHGKYDYSFSGLKTAVLRRTQQLCGVSHDFPSTGLAELLNDSQRNDIAASFQRIAVETLVDKTMLAYQEHSPASVVIAGGVAANNELRKQLRQRLPIDIQYAPISLCTDNAAMIAALTYYRAQIDEPVDPYTLEVLPSLSM